MRKIKFTLHFFANLLQTNEKSLSFCIIERKFQDGASLFHCGIMVENLSKYVFDIEEGVFVSLINFGEDKLLVHKGAVCKISGSKFVFEAEKNKSEYEKKAFLGFYKNRVMNPLLT